MNKTKMAALALCALSALPLAGCSTGSGALIPDDNPYQWANTPVPQAQPDEGVVIDGNFDDPIWQNTTWLNGVDAPETGKTANIKVGTAITEKGLYLAFDVEETGTNIWVNPDRADYCNSCIEMYMDSPDADAMTQKAIEFDLIADGSYALRRRAGYNGGWKSAYYRDGDSPVMACSTKGGPVNDRACYGYSYEVFMPKSYLEYLGYEFSTDMEVAINPVHIISLEYNSTDSDVARLYSQWIDGYVDGYRWDTPRTWPTFDKQGLAGYKINVNQSGDPSLGMVSGLNGVNLVNKGHSGKLEVLCLNGGQLKSLTVNGKDAMNDIVWQGDFGTLDIGTVTADVNVTAAFGK